MPFSTSNSNWVRNTFGNLVSCTGTTNPAMLYPVVPTSVYLVNSEEAASEMWNEHIGWVRDTPSRTLPIVDYHQHYYNGTAHDALNRQRRMERSRRLLPVNMDRHYDTVYEDDMLRLGSGRQVVVGVRLYTGRPKTYRDSYYGFNEEYLDPKYKLFESTVDAIRRAGVRIYHIRAQDKFELHPAIKYLLDQARKNPAYSPADPMELALQWPHVSEEDPKQIAYIQSPEKGERGLYTRTNLGRYLRRHFPGLKDHEVRDYVEYFTTDSQFKFIEDPDGMLEALLTGPHSCMKRSEDSWGHDHPYRVYDPKYGWKLAVQYKVTKQLKARALVYNSGDEKVFVRTYDTDDKNPGEYHSSSAHALESWLKQQGYKHSDEWPDGAKLAYIDAGARGYFVSPYIDGEVHRVDIVAEEAEGEGKYLRLGYAGKYKLRHDNGKTCFAKTVTCHNCNDSVAEETAEESEEEDTDGWMRAGQDNEYWVCPDCRDDYIYVRGSYGDEYYVHSDEMVEIGGDYYHERYLHHNGIVRLDYYYEGEEFAREDEAVQINGDWWHRDDDRIVILDAGSMEGEYARYEDTFVCAHDDQRYSLSEDEYREDGRKLIYEGNWEEYCEDNGLDPETGDALPDDDDSNPVMEVQDSLGTVEAAPPVATEEAPAAIVPIALAATFDEQGAIV